MHRSRVTTSKTSPLHDEARTDLGIISLDSRADERRRGDLTRNETMGRKKKRAELPWCFYCDREFDDEKILQQHQRAKHFKCAHPRCNKKLMTAPGMQIHMLTVHKIKVEKVPNAIEGRDNPEWLIEGMNGIPEGFDYENNKALVDESTENVVHTGKRPNLNEQPGIGGVPVPGGPPGGPGGVWGPPPPGAMGMRPMMPPPGAMGLPPPGMPPPFGVMPPPGGMGMPPPGWMPPPGGMMPGMPPAGVVPPAATAPAPAAPKPVQAPITETVMVWADETESIEERRASLSKYNASNETKDDDAKGDEGTD